MIAHARAAAIVVAVVGLTLALLPLHETARRMRWPLRKSTARLWHRLTVPLLGLKVHVHGTPPGDLVPGVLIASNHVSWIDIVALGSVAKVSFIAKNEVKGWPFFGQLAHWQDSVFIARDARRAARKQADAVAARLSGGDHLVLFAEGTTSDGNFVQPFKSALFGAVGLGGANGAAVQPVAIAYTGIDGMPMGRRHRPLASWPGDVALGPHLWRVLRERGIDVSIAFAPPIPVNGETDRKHLAAEAEQRVRSMASAMLRGRNPTFVADENELRTPP